MEWQGKLHRLVVMKGLGKERHSQTAWARYFAMLERELTDNEFSKDPKLSSECHQNMEAVRRIEEALNWLISHIGQPYIPDIRSANSFRDKFRKLEDAMKRTPPDPIPVSALEDYQTTATRYNRHTKKTKVLTRNRLDSAKELYERLTATYRWEKDSLAALPGMLKTSCDDTIGPFRSACFAYMKKGKLDEWGCLDDENDKLRIFIGEKALPHITVTGLIEGPIREFMDRQTPGNEKWECRNLTKLTVTRENLHRCLDHPLWIQLLQTLEYPTE
jgi:hypothetical protein